MSAGRANSPTGRSFISCGGIYAAMDEYHLGTGGKKLAPVDLLRRKPDPAVFASGAVP